MRKPCLVHTERDTDTIHAPSTRLYTSLSLRFGTLLQGVATPLGVLPVYIYNDNWWMVDPNSNQF